MPSNYLALDVGGVRIGLALANSIARLAAPLPAVSNDAGVWANLQVAVNDNAVDQLVVGLPRGLDGQETAQTEYVRNFVVQLEQQLNLPISFQDEALTSVKAEAELAGRKHGYQKGDVDSLSAVYILEDFLNEHVH